VQLRPRGIRGKRRKKVSWKRFLVRIGGKVVLGLEYVFQ
jgi:hypothetical protein